MDKGNNRQILILHRKSERKAELKKQIIVFLYIEVNKVKLKFKLNSQITHITHIHQLKSERKVERDCQPNKRTVFI